MMEGIFFVAAATGVILFALGVVISRNPLRAALSLIATLTCLAFLFVLLEASFVAAMQILVYAGAIMVLFVFVIMLLNLGRQPHQPFDYFSLSKWFGTFAVGYLVWRVVQMVAESSGEVGDASGWIPPALDSSVLSMGRVLLTDYLFAFEAISVLLLVAVVGSIVLALRKLPGETS